jgi:nucleoside-diphosphate kinase
MGYGNNVIHGSDSVENAKAEVARFFKEEELLDYTKDEFMHVYSEDERV